MDLILSRLGAKKEGNTHPFYPLMLPPGTIAQDKPVPKTESDTWPDPDVPSCKTEIDNDVAVLMETYENIPTCVKTEPDEPEVIKLENDACNEPLNSVNPIDSEQANSDLLIDPRKSIGAPVMVKEKPERKMAKPIQYKNYAQNQARSLKLLSIKKYVGKRKRHRTPKIHHPLKEYVFNVEYRDMAPSPENPEGSKAKYYQYITECARDVFKDTIHLKCINHKSSKNNPINCRARLTLTLNTDKLAIVAGALPNSPYSKFPYSWSPANKLEDYFDIENYSFKKHYCNKSCNDKCLQEKGSNCSSSFCRISDTVSVNKSPIECFQDPQ